ncbi:MULTISPECIES: hypothetical protein [Aeromonas]|uniref:hypothetical protein n=1 Tax=Aeromonas TaxID=642 RepID=UPI00197D5585|nr:hypothetical protein [Aeromonas dhakensis]MBW3731799.1 hypothetical protein [Aeromonas dhakensis]QSR56405.1 hypothetical protein GO601_13765 [Aeromonas dhakensis]HDZ8856109.1 hypothetical protein [Aeromonas dhakensis]
MNELIYKSKKYVHEKYGFDKLLIVMNTHNQGDRYFGYSTLTHEPKSDLLFITDPSNGYYLDDNQGADYLELITNISRNYDKDKVCIFGTSMAGYAALFFGSKLGFHIIASNPQLDFDITYKLSWENLRDSLDKIKNKINISDIYSSGYNGGNIFFIYGEHRLDIANADIFKSLDFNEKVVIIKKIKSIEHGFFIKDLNNLFYIQNKLISFKKDL